MPNSSTPIKLPGCGQEHQPSLSIVVMVTNGVEQVDRCLRSLEVVGLELDRCQTILVLNDPTAAVRKFIADRVTCDEVIDSPVNLGTSVSWQLAFNRARADRVLLLHEDAAARPGAVPALMAAMDENPDAACVGPLLAALDDEEPSNAGWLAWREHLETRLQFSDLSDENREHPYAVDVLSSAFAIWDRRAWDDIGGFDERRYPAIGIDFDACLGAWNIGRSTLVVPTVKCDHHSGAMDTRDGPLGGKPVRHFLLSEFREFWNEKWSQVDGDFVSLRDRGLSDFPDADALAAGLANAAERRRTAAGRTSGFRSAVRPITDPDETGARPVDVSDALVERIAQLEARVVERYQAWLVDRYEALSNDLRRATSEGALLFESREAIALELAQRDAEVLELTTQLAERDRTLAELESAGSQQPRGLLRGLRAAKARSSE